MSPKIDKIISLDRCSVCGEEACETKFITNVAGEFFARDCQPITYDQLPSWMIEEMNGEDYSQLGDL